MQTNRLLHEKSPYLLQHAHNPVDWFPWGDEAFEKARREDKPIFLSIGYSTCHWCHVMERESFENPEIAALMNRWFVSIKMDREERPDIDRIYMTYVQAATGSGGWPMSVWLTPDLHPFVGGTYFPPDNRYGRPGFATVLERIAAAWKDDRARIVESSRNVMQQLREAGAASPESGASGSDRIDASLLESAFWYFRRSFDSKLGGFGAAPKFPRPSVHDFLLRYWKRTGDDEALDMVVSTLIAMENGGINDQLGGGFHRYSVDEYWFVPHFEKMLYDQAQLVASYIETFQIAREPVLASAAARTLDYVLRDMTSPEGGFYSAEDADSAIDATHPREKGEGAFYLWIWSEVVALLGEERAGWFGFRYGMEPEGNVRNDPHGEFTGRNILFLAHTVEDTAQEFDRPSGEMQSSLDECSRVLFEARSKRPRPHLDDKILTAWNGLMISAFVKAGAVLARREYIDAAGRAASMILSRMIRDGRLLRRYRAGDAAIPGLLDDYAFFVQALLDLYEVTGAFPYLESAIALTEVQRELFEDREAGGFFASAQEDASRLMRVKDDYDGAEPSGNSIALMNLLRLHRITGRGDFDASARKLISAFQRRIASTPHGMPKMLCAAEFDLAPPREIVVAGELDPEMARLPWQSFDPNRVVLHASPQLAEWQPQVAEMRGPAAYVCENFTCREPARNAQDFARLLK